MWACESPSDGNETAPTARGCIDDSHCRTDQLCIFGLCSDSCAGPDDCERGLCFDTGRGSACVRLQDNACVTSANCPARTRCAAGRCLTACEAGMGRSCLAGQVCSEGVCVSAGPGVVEDSEPAADGGRLPPPLAEAGMGVETPACPTGSVQCRDQDVVRCDEHGRAEVEETCAFACRDGACLGFCTPGTTRCEGSERQRCDDAGDWQPIETCPSLCTPDSCAATCDEGERACNDAAIVRCQSGAWIDESACSSVCRDGECGGSCSPGTRRCADGAASTCAADGTWMPPVACENACVEGGCTGLCVPGTQRCAGAGHYQVCGQLGQWRENESCDGHGCFLGSCTGECAPGSMRCDPSGAPDCTGPTCPNNPMPMPTTCSSGQSPDWYSEPIAGGSQTLDDPRWQVVGMSEFASAPGQNAGGHLIVLDRESRELKVSLRVTLGTGEIPQVSDYVFFGITPNLAGAPAGRRVVIPLVDMLIGEKAKPITAFQRAEFAGMWRDDRAARAWIEHVSGWRGNTVDPLSWAINFRVSLAAAQVDPSKPVRISLAVHADSAATDLTTPVNAASLTERPGEWALAKIAPAVCVTGVQLE